MASADQKKVGLLKQDSMADLGETLLDDEAARANIQENQKWMLGGYIHPHHKKDVEEAFKIIHADIEVSEGANGEVEDMVAGPGVKWALLGNIMTWSTFVIVTFASTYFVEVSKQGIAQKPAGRYMVFGILIWAGFTTVAIILEYKALMYCLPTQAVCVFRKAEGKEAWTSFNRWMLLMFVISIALHADVYTTGIFMARVWKSIDSCNTLNNVWKLAICESFLNNVPIVNVLTFGQLCFAAWWLMILQFVYALFYSIPISPNVAKNMDVSNARVDHVMVSDKAHVQLFDTVMKKNTGHGRCLQALSESGRMCSLNWQDDLYLQQAERDWDCHRVHDEMRRTNFRFMLFCTQATAIPNLQITFLGVQKANQAILARQTPGSEPTADYTTILSFTISFLVGLHYIYYECGSVARHQKYARHANQAEKKRALEKKNGRKYWDAQLLEWKVKFSIRANYMFTLLFCGIYCFILVKATMVIVFCESGIWNAKFDAGNGYFMHGCVPVHMLPELHCPINATTTCPLH